MSYYGLISNAPAPFALPRWDADNNLFSNSSVTGFASHVSSVTTITLTVSSPQILNITGTHTQLVVLPVESTLVEGQSFTIYNNSSGTVTIHSSGGNQVIEMNGTTYIVCTCILNSGTTAASWNAQASSIYPPINNINGDTGNLSGIGFSGVVIIQANQASLGCGSSVAFNNNSMTSTLQVTDTNYNTVIGLNSGSLTDTGTENTILGANSFSASGKSISSITSVGVNNIVAAGSGTNGALLGINIANTNDAINNMCAFGINIFTGISGGTDTGLIGIGINIGQNYSGGESNNVLISSGSSDLAGESGVIRLGDPATHVAFFGAGINSVNSSSFANPLPVYIDSSTGQMGYGSLLPYISNSDYLFVGSSTGNVLTGGMGNVAVGTSTFNTASGGAGNALFGSYNGSSLAGSGPPVATANSLFGTHCGTFITTGSFNCLFGNTTGVNYTSSESNNILIGANLFGTAGESGVIRIGVSGTQTTCFISGINNTSSSGFTSPLAVFIDSVTGQMGYGTPSGAAGRWLNRQWLSATGTYTPTPGTNTILGRGVGGGGGSPGSGAGSTNGGTGGTTSFNGTTMTALGGTGSTTSGAPGGGAGTGTGNAAQDGTPGNLGTNASGIVGAAFGGNGGASLLGPGGLGSGNTTAIDAMPNSGGGAGGILSTVATFGYSGAGSGGYSEFILTGVSGTYSFVIGAGGAPGAAGAGGFIGARGGSGYIIIDEFS